MSIAKNNTLAYSDLSSLYSSFNTFINRWRGYGGTNITTVTTPAQGKVNATDINTLNDKIKTFQADSYLSTQSSYWKNATVTAGNTVYASDVTNINTTISNMPKVVCRNTGTNSKSSHTQCKKSHNCPDCQKSHSTNGNCQRTHGNHSQTCTNGGRSLWCYPMNNPKVCVDGTNNISLSNRTWDGAGWWKAVSKLWIGSNNNKTGSVGGCTQALWAEGDCPVDRGDGWPGWVQYWAHSCSVTCLHSTNGNCQCSNTNHGQGCTNGNKGVACSHTNKGVACGHTTFIDITKSHTSKSN